MNLQLLLEDCGEHIKQIHTKKALFRRHCRIQFEKCLMAGRVLLLSTIRNGKISYTMAPVCVL